MLKPLGMLIGAQSMVQHSVVWVEIPFVGPYRDAITL